MHQASSGSTMTGAIYCRCRPAIHSRRWRRRQQGGNRSHYVWLDMGREGVRPNGEGPVPIFNTSQDFAIWVLPDTAEVAVLETRRSRAQGQRMGVDSGTT